MAEDTGESPVPEINLMPMIDVIFLLIIFFMFVSELASLESYAPVQLPEAVLAKPNPAPPPERVVVNILSDGGLVVAGDKYTWAKLRNVLLTESMISRKANDGKNEVSVLIRADAGAPSAVLRRMFMLCLEPGIGITRLAVQAVRSEDF